MILTRGAGSTLLAELAKPAFYPVTLVYLDWPSGEVWFHTNRGSITWDSNTWTGVGDFATISVPPETAGLVPSTATLRIVGTIDDILDASEEAVKNRAGAIYFGCVTSRAGATLVGDPVEVWSGYMDGTVVEVGEDGGRQIYALELTLGSGPGARVGASITHSQEDQAARYPGDTAGRHTQFAVANARKLTWPE
jgi:hypothetical protein